MVIILYGVTALKAVLSSLDSKLAKLVGGKAWIDNLAAAHGAYSICRLQLFCVAICLWDLVRNYAV